MSAFLLGKKPTEVARAARMPWCLAKSGLTRAIAQQLCRKYGVAGSRGLFQVLPLVPPEHMGDLVKSDGQTAMLLMDLAICADVHSIRSKARFASWFFRRAAEFDSIEPAQREHVTEDIRDWFRYAFTLAELSDGHPGAGVEELIDASAMRDILGPEHRALPSVFTFTNEPLSRALRECRQWHESVAKIADSAASIFPRFGMPDAAVLDGVAFSRIADSKALRDEGRRMHHCVGSYCEMIRRGTCAIYHVSSGTWNGTLEVRLLDGMPQNIGQLRGPCNAKAPTPVIDAAKDFVRMAQDAVRSAREQP